MRKLELQAEASGYSSTPGASSLSAILDGPAGHHRPDYEGAPTLVSLNWLLSPEEYQYLRAFWRTATSMGAEPFLVDLIMSEGVVREHVARFVPGSMQLSTVLGEAFGVRVIAEAQPAFELATSELLDLLARLVNVDLPESIGEPA